MPDSHVIELDFSKGLDAPDSPGEWRYRDDKGVVRTLHSHESDMHRDCCTPRGKYLKLVDATPKRPPQPFPEAVWVDDHWEFPPEPPGVVWVCWLKQDTGSIVEGMCVSGSLWRQVPHCAFSFARVPMPTQEVRDDAQA